MATLGFALNVAWKYDASSAASSSDPVVTIVSIIFGTRKFGGVFDVPPRLARSPAMDLGGALKVGLVTVVFASCLSTFDNTGPSSPSPHAAVHAADGTVPRL